MSTRSCQISEECDSEFNFDAVVGFVERVFCSMDTRTRMIRSESIFMCEGPLSSAGIVLVRYDTALHHDSARTESVAQQRVANLARLRSSLEKHLASFRIWPPLKWAAGR